MSTTESNTERLKSIALNLGFDLVGIAKAEYDPIAHDRLLTWIGRGFAGTMKYMERNPRRRVDPELTLEGAKSIITVAMSYRQEPHYSRIKPYVSIYARGKVYQEVMKDKLAHLADEIRKIKAGSRTKIAVDTSPVMDKLWAKKSGIGWQGKNTLVINERLGSFLFLGEVFTDIELIHDAKTRDLCGSCTKCLDICPTGALIGPNQLDARRCISYMTIEDADNESNYDKIMNNIIGCDLCQLVCPYNKKDAIGPNAALQTRSKIDWQRGESWTIESDNEFQAIFSETILAKYGFNRYTKILSAVMNNLKTAKGRLRGNNDN